MWCDMDSFETKKRKISLYALLDKMAPDIGLNDDDIHRFIESVEVDPENLHDLIYKLAENGLIDGDTLNDYLDAADIVE